MNVVDSSGWLEFFTDSLSADVFRPMIENEENLIVPTTCLYVVEEG